MKIKRIKKAIKAIRSILKAFYFQFLQNFNLIEKLKATVQSCKLRMEENDYEGTLVHNFCIKLFEKFVLLDALIQFFATGFEFENDILHDWAKKNERDLELRREWEIGDWGDIKKEGGEFYSLISVDGLRYLNQLLEKKGGTISDDLMVETCESEIESQGPSIRCNLLDMLQIQCGSSLDVYQVKEGSHRRGWELIKISPIVQNFNQISERQFEETRVMSSEEVHKNTKLNITNISEGENDDMLGWIERSGFGDMEVPEIIQKKKSKKKKKRKHRVVPDEGEMDVGINDARRKLGIEIVISDNEEEVNMKVEEGDNEDEIEDEFVSKKQKLESPNSILLSFFNNTPLPERVSSKSIVIDFELSIPSHSSYSVPKPHKSSKFFPYSTMFSNSSNQFKKVTKKRISSILTPTSPFMKDLLIEATLHVFKFSQSIYLFTFPLVYPTTFLRVQEKAYQMNIHLLLHPSSTPQTHQFSQFNKLLESLSTLILLESVNSKHIISFLYELGDQLLASSLESSFQTLTIPSSISSNHQLLETILSNTPDNIQRIIFCPFFLIQDEREIQFSESVSEVSFMFVPSIQQNQFQNQPIVSIKGHGLTKMTFSSMVPNIQMKSASYISYLDLSSSSPPPPNHQSSNFFFSNVSSLVQYSNQTLSHFMFERNSFSFLQLKDLFSSLIKFCPSLEKMSLSHCSIMINQRNFDDQNEIHSLRSQFWSTFTHFCSQSKIKEVEMDGFQFQNIIDKMEEELEIEEDEEKKVEICSSSSQLPQISFIQYISLPSCHLTHFSYSQIPSSDQNGCVITPPCSVEEYEILKQEILTNKDEKLIVKFDL